jgi:hypothetical protein
MVATPYPDWQYYPKNRRPDKWVTDLLGVVASARPDIDTAVNRGSVRSDSILAYLRPGLVALDYTVEASKKKVDKVIRPVLFGPQGSEDVHYEVDAMHDLLGIVLEIEAGRGARANAVYRDLIRASLIVEARFFAIGVMRTYRHARKAKPEGTEEVQGYRETIAQLDAIYASRRLALPFDGVLVFGY